MKGTTDSDPHRYIFREPLNGKQAVLIQNQCLRVINNAIADQDENRMQLLQQHEFLEMVLSSLETDFGNIDIVNKELSVLNNLVDDFAAGAQYLAGSELALRALMRQLEMVTINTALQSTLVCYIISEMLEHGHARFPTSIASTLLENASVKIVGSSPVDIYSTTDDRASTGFQEEGKEATLLLIKFVESDTRFEEYFASNRDYLVQFIQLGIAFSLLIQTADDFPQIARRIVAAMGSVSSHPRFQTIVDISLQDPVFGLFVHQMKEPPPTPRASILFQGISCIVLGNLVTSSEQEARLLQEFPAAPALAMKYLSVETDPYALQGAHLIKNLTVANHAVCREVVDRGGIALVFKLLDHKLFANLRVMGVQIAKNILHMQIASKTVHSQFLRSLAQALIAAYKKDDSQLVRDQITLTMCVAVERSRKFFEVKYTPNMQVQHLSQDEDEFDKMASSLNDTLVDISKILINVLKTIRLGIVSGQQHVPETIVIKATKALGIVSTFLMIPEDYGFGSMGAGIPGYVEPLQQQPLLQCAVSKETEEGAVAYRDLVEVLKCSKDMVERSSGANVLDKDDPLSIDEGDMLESRNSSDKPAQASSSYAAVVNNLGFAASQILKWKDAGSDLCDAARVAVQNAADCGVGN